PERILRLQRRGDRRAHRPVAGEQIAELVARRAVCLHDVVGDLVQAPLCRPGAARRARGIGGPEELLEALERLRHAAADDRRRRQRAVVAEVVTRARAERGLHLGRDDAHRSSWGGPRRPPPPPPPPAPPPPPRGRPRPPPRWTLHPP